MFQHLKLLNVTISIPIRNTFSFKSKRSCNIYFIYLLLLDIQDNGGGWTPFILYSQAQLDFIKQAQKGLSHDRSYWIGGSTDSAPWSTIDLTDDYNTDLDPGDFIVIFLL